MLFISRLNKAYQDTNGYTELVIYPPPFSMLSVLLLPFVMSKKWMKWMAYKYSRMIFWIENVIYISLMGVNFLILIPFTYFKITFNIIRIGSLLSTIMLMPLWLLLGPFYLVYAFNRDLFNFGRSLNRNYQLKAKEHEAEDKDLINDKIIIYNEVIDVMRAIKYLYEQTKKRHIERKAKSDIIKESGKFN